VISRAVSHRIDLLKGLAIIAVLIQHGLPDSVRYDSLATLHYWQAVPVFIFLMGFNGAGSFRRSGLTEMGALYGGGYWRKRARRLGVPIALAWVASLMLGACAGRLSGGPLMLAGVFPMSGPGNYFITLTVEFTVLAPALYVVVRRAPWATLAAVFAVELAYELVAGALDPGGSGFNYLYNSGIPRYATICTLGMIVALMPALPRPSAWPLAAGAAVGASYLVYFGLQRGEVGAFVSYSGPSNAISSGYPVWLALLGLAALPATRLAFVARLGRASFHVFLAQMLWFALATGQGLGHVALAIPISVLGGFGLEWLDRQVTQRAGAATKLRDRRVAARS
jgi:peptidoglycan/LPS O-acetylase OafA/YrhL